MSGCCKQRPGIGTVSFERDWVGGLLFLAIFFGARPQSLYGHMYLEVIARDFWFTGDLVVEAAAVVHAALWASEGLPTAPHRSPQDGIPESS